MPNNRPGTTRTVAPGSARTLDALSNAMTGLCVLFEHEEIDRAEFIERCTRLVSEAIGCSRVGLWVFVETAAGRMLRCVAMYDSANRRMTRVPDETGNIDPYFLALQQHGYVLASDARDHPAITGSFAERLEARGVRSLLAASFSVNGAIYGAFTCTEVDRESLWSPRQLAALRQVGAQASMSLFRRSRFTANTGLGPLA